jgi:polyphosphate kinase
MTDQTEKTMAANGETTPEAPATPRKTATRTRRRPAARAVAVDPTPLGAEEPKPEVEAPQEAPQTKAEPVAAVATDEPNLKAPELYLNRELTWLSFNCRVLNEARDRRTPLLERVKFLAITGSNMDEFFMKRIGGLKQQVGAGVHKTTVDGRTPEQQIVECCERVRNMRREIRDTYVEVLRLLKRQRIDLTTYDKLKAEEKEFLRHYYYDNIFPLVTPQAMDPAHPFPFISNLSMNLLVTLHHSGYNDQNLARVKVPLGMGIPRFLRVGEEDRFVRLEDVMAHNLDLLFPGMDIDSCEVFRVTRNANTERDEEQADDLLEMIELELRDRKLAPIVRMEVMADMDPTRRGMLANELGLNEETDVFETDIILALRDLWELVKLQGADLHDPDHFPVENDKLHDPDSIFHIIRRTGPIFLFHPYESFTTSVERFVREASLDPKVRAIKMTLYRTSATTKIIAYLAGAARNGKQVAVAVELKARFDEAANIRWAKDMEEAGIHVTYGVVGLKTHCKVILVVRQDYDGLRRYAHIGTGNYHADTARIYSDMGILTCDEGLGEGLTELFNYLTTGYKPKRDYRKLLPAPKNLKKALLEKIDREIALHSPESPGLIRFKTNALEDKNITEALYRASRAGVKVDLIVRDTCRLRPGLPGISDNVRVVSIVGRFLEHARIFHFRNGGEEEYYIGSADLMKRNLESRVELVTPVGDPALKSELGMIMDIQLTDRRSAWDMQSDGTYVQRQPGRGDDPRSSHEILIDLAEKRKFEATRLRKRKPKGVAKRGSR